MKWLLGALLILFLVAGGFLLSPSPIDSKAWQAPAAPPLTGKLAPNERLRLADLLGRGQVSGPEDAAVDAEDRVYAGTRNGLIVRIGADERVEGWLETGGRPLGMVFDGNGDLIVAHAGKGLLAVTPDKAVSLLSREAEGLPFGLTDGVDIAPDGRIYFTDASARFGYSDYRLDLLEMRPHGRFLRYDPRRGKAEVLLGNLHFPNGVAISPQGDYVLVSETWKYRILKYWIRGPKAGRAEVFVDNLPGFPDNLAVDDLGRYWVAFPALRDSRVDSLHRHPWLKDLVAKLPDGLKPTLPDYGLVVAFDASGEVITSLHDTRGSHLSGVTSATPHAGYLYLGTLRGDRLGRLPLKAIPGLAGE